MFFIIVFQNQINLLAQAENQASAKVYPSLGSCLSSVCFCMISMVSILLLQTQELRETEKNDRQQMREGQSYIELLGLTCEPSACSDWLFCLVSLPWLRLSASGALIGFLVFLFGIFAVNQSMFTLHHLLQVCLKPKRVTSHATSIV